MIPISIYISAFNVIKNGFSDNLENIKKACEFAEEVVVAINKSEDATVEFIQELKLGHNLNNLKIINTDFDYSDPLLDGKVKNAALQACSNEILVQLDLDEYIPRSQRALWDSYAQYLLSESQVKAVLIPSVNLFKDMSHYKDITQKWYMHKKGLYRGPVIWARNNDGTVDTNKSDTCELVDESGKLVFSYPVIFDMEYAERGEIPFVVHCGYLSLESRIIRNKMFWKEHWVKESGGKNPPHKVHMTNSDFDGVLSHKHNLILV